MVTKVEAARIATGFGIPVVLTAAPLAAAALAGDEVGTLFHRDRTGRRPGCSGWPTPPRPGAGCTSTRARSPRWWPEQYGTGPRRRQRTHR